MGALPLYEVDPAVVPVRRGSHLRLVRDIEVDAGSGEFASAGVGGGERTGRPAPRRRVPIEVRRRRALLAVASVALILLALPWGGSANSTPTATLAAAELHPITYHVQPGDSLWSIAERVDPTGDPQPLVAQMARQLGSENVVPGEVITVP